MLICGDALIELKKLPDNYCDSLITDPPAGIKMNGQDWDSDKGGRDRWIKWLTEIMVEVKRVLKPGGHGLVWALPRTSHWTATALENAGFEIRDVIHHLFGSGFPKGLDYGKLDSTLRGFNTSLKPATEHWILVRKPTVGTAFSNMKQWGTGGLNIDACRVGNEEITTHHAPAGTFGGGAPHKSSTEYKQHLGRHPANLVLSCECEDGYGISVVTERTKRAITRAPSNLTYGTFHQHTNSTLQEVATPHQEHCVASTLQHAAKYFYCAKATTVEREYGLDGYYAKYGKEELTGKGNIHPTVKSLKLMTYLIKLITPPQGKVLDCFVGSGSTLIAAREAGFSFVGIEKEPTYARIAAKRLGIEGF